MMKKPTKPLDRLRGLTSAIARYPLTAVFLLAAAVFLALSIQTDHDYAKQLLTCAVGAFLSAALQAAYERFFDRLSARLVLYGCGIILTLGYYLIVRQIPAYSMELSVRTGVALFALFFALLWVPVIRSKVSFNESFMAAFKAFFHAALYAAVLFGGCVLIITAIDTLIVNINYRSYSHVANIVFVLFAPIFFLSLIPVYPGREDDGMDWESKAAREETVSRAAGCPKFLEVLISYIIIPLTAVFTVILVLYIVLNIGGAFWTNNLLEPMLISYAIAVILVYLLSSRLENKIAGLFRLIFPKVLIPIVLFQIASSILSLRDTGMTHTRYFVILFGVFATCAGVVMSVLPVRKSGLIAAMLIVFSAVSVIPPVDAFTVSRRSQESLLKTVLTQNGMLENDAIIPNGALSDADKKKIVMSVEYLDRMGYTDKIAWMPENFTVYEDFYDTFGFNQYDLPQNTNRYVNVALNSKLPVDIAGYDVFAHTGLNDGDASGTVCEIEHLGTAYILKKENAGNADDLVLTDDRDQEIIRFHTADIFARYADYSADKTELSVEDAAFSAENGGATLTVIVQNANI